MRPLVGYRIGCLAFLLSTFSISVTAADWQQFRGPGGQGASTEKGIPARFSADENVAWKKELPGPGASSPIVVGDRVIVTSYSGYGRDVEKAGEMEDLRLWVVAMRASDGESLWKREISPRLPESEEVRDHGYAAPTPASDGKAIFAFFGKSGVIKLSLDGDILWQKTVGDETHGWGCGTSPVLYDNLVIVNASVESGSLVALDKGTGNEVWRAPGMRESWNTPHLVELEGGKKELVVSVQGWILGFDPATGRELWRAKGIDDYVCPSVVSKDGIVYATGGRSSRVVAVRAGGRGNVTSSHRLWEARTGANVSSPVIHDGHLYGVSDRTPVAYCVRLSDGEVVFSERVNVQPYASSVLIDGKLFVVTRREGVLVLAAKPAFEVIARNRLDDRTTFDASPAVADGKLFVRSNRHLWAISDKRRASE